VILQDELNGMQAIRRAVEVSLYTWARAKPDDVLDDGQKMGWWGDSYPSVVSDQIGSRLWLLRRHKFTDELPRLAEDYAKEALQWLLDDDVVFAFNVSAQRRGREAVDLQVEVTLLDGMAYLFDFNDVWSVQYVL
jgi:phage gp46-like protein